MATKRSQRIAIWVIAVALAAGTIGSFVVMILANDNLQNAQKRIDELTAVYRKELEAYDAKVAGYAEKQSDEFAKFAERVGTFDADAVTELTTKDLRDGTGFEVTADMSYDAYYVGWNPDGKVFDSTLEDGQLTSPLTVMPGYLIEGWAEGTVGMKGGGVRELTIPSELAYREFGQGEDIPPNTPLKFIIMVVPFERPQPSEELVKLLNSTR